MDTAGSSTAAPESRPSLHLPDPNAHDDAFYAATNPKFFGLPLGVLIAAAVSAVSVCITVVKFLGLHLAGH